MRAPHPPFSRAYADTSQVIAVTEGVESLLDTTTALVRYCTRCAARVATDNSSSMCSACARSAQTGPGGSPQLDRSFWETDLMRDALASQDMGVVVAAYRRHPRHGRRALAQSLVAGWLGITQGQLSRIESGRNKIRDIDRLRDYASVLHIPHELLWFATADPSPSRERRPKPMNLPGGVPRPATSHATDAALADSLLATLRQYSTTDNMTGPAPMLPLAEAQATFINSLLADAGPSRKQLLYVGARFAEFIGWLNQDSGNIRAAMTWSNRALDMATEIKRPGLISYILMRKSNIAFDAGRPDVVLELARAAAEVPGELTSRMRALAARQEAHAHALLGDQDACAHALDRAFELATAPTQDTDIARYCTPSYIEMEAAHCWVELEKPERALGALQQGLAEWRPEFRRDLGLGLARFAVAHARTGEPDDALDIAMEAVRILSETGSVRTAKQLYRASSILHTTGARSEGADLRHSLQTTLRLRG
ncbi:helix-turn-helix domain-containing protein [Promicromonospora umidemergens]|uniref:HTH cro/C1-type domain-containing protein n=1 Tax=Promicromonospora umidemergens TaxID=629679 RepID=A0ABP8WH80_9MICO|nr:helix-turn-helix transcriptional regulator [Promicromonospora umidemergens]